MARSTHYLKEVRIELKKVNWPTRNETVKYTIAVIGISLALAVFFGGLDYVFSWVLNNFVI
jgi:preprotein translocase subunit SecE